VDPELRKALDEMKIEDDSLYREDVFTDRRVGRIVRLTPVNLDGSTDKMRQVLFVAHSQIMSNAGPLPVASPIEASSLKEAAQKFPEAIARGIEEMVEEVKEMQRREASRIVVPGVETTRKIVTGPGS
jgi:hypothetical protein